MTTLSTGASAPLRSARFARISCVQQITGALGLTAPSPVTIPTFAAPSSAHSAKNFSDTSALTGAV